MSDRPASDHSAQPPPPDPTTPLNVVIGVGGGIAAYKACQLVRLFTEAGHRVRVIPTVAALQFVGAPTWEALSGAPVTTSVFDDVDQVPHVRVGRAADLVVVAPATADLLARAAHGLADDLLTTTLLTARCPVLFAPAMHTEMWQHPATVANTAVLRARPGVTVLEPDSGRLTGADSGPGRLPEPQAIHDAAMALLPGGPSRRDLAGTRVLISAGGTREPLDPVRYLGNRSSGRQGFALASRARDRGAEVTLVSTVVDPSTVVGPSRVVSPGMALAQGITVVPVETAAQMRTAMLDHAAAHDVVIMAAAVADFRPADVVEHKIKKTDDDDAPVIRLVRNPDILAELAGPARRPGQCVVGFAAETGDPSATAVEHARNKLARKGCDLLVLNDVSQGRAFGTPTNEVMVLDREGGHTEVAEADKHVIADRILDLVAARLGRAT